MRAGIKSMGEERKGPRMEPLGIPILKEEELGGELRRTKGSPRKKGVRGLMYLRRGKSLRSHSAVGSCVNRSWNLEARGRLGSEKEQITWRPRRSDEEAEAVVDHNPPEN